MPCKTTLAGDPCPKIHLFRLDWGKGIFCNHTCLLEQALLKIRTLWHLLQFCRAFRMELFHQALVKAVDVKSILAFPDNGLLTTNDGTADQQWFTQSVI